MRFISIQFAIVACLMVLAAPALASDGVLEINKACVATGCFPGDAPGFPVTITASGSYRLTGNLNQLAVGSSASGIEISASNVTLDLSGFTISCAGAFGGDCSGTAHGVHAPNIGLTNIRVQNGIVRDMPSSGVLLQGGDMSVKDIQATQNGEDGIVAGGYLQAGGFVDGSTATFNGGWGIKVSTFNGLIKGSLSRANTAGAIQGTPWGMIPSSSSGYTQCMTSGTISFMSDMGSNYP